MDAVMVSGKDLCVVSGRVVELSLVLALNVWFRTRTHGRTDGMCTRTLYLVKILSLFSVSFFSFFVWVFYRTCVGVTWNLYALVSQIYRTSNIHITPDPNTLIHNKMGNYLATALSSATWSDYQKAMPIAILLAMELSSAKPISRSLTFLKQLWGQVSNRMLHECTCTTKL